MKRLQKGSHIIEFAVLAGVFLLIWRLFSPGPMRAVALYWHFVDLVWVLLFTIVYLF